MTLIPSSAALRAALFPLLLALACAAGAARAQGAAPAADAARPAAGGTAVPTFNDPVSAKREYELALQLRCLVCQNQSIAESHADLAVDLRRQVREQIAAGKTDRDIIDFMTSRYGDFVLYKPPVKGTTLLLWVGPFAGLLLGALVLWRVVKARKAAPVPAPLSDEERARAAALLGEGSRK